MKAYMIDPQITATRNYDVEQAIFDAAGIEFVIEPCENEDEILAKCADANAILSAYKTIGEKTVQGLKDLKALVRYGIGYDNFDVDAATAAGVMVCNIPHYCVPEVATHTTAMILACTRHLLLFNRDVKAGKWRTGALDSLKMRRPSTQWVGLVSFGEIARTVAGQLLAIGYNVMAYDPYQSAEVFKKAGVKQVELDELYAKSDIISLHAPLNNETRGMINAASIAKMMDGVVLVNTSRGGVINEADLAEAVKSGKISAAALDVLNVEPMTDPEDPLAKLDNVMLSPHLAFRSDESFHALCAGVAETAVKVLQGEVPDNVVNKKQLGL